MAGSLAELSVNIIGDVSDVRKAFDELGKGVDNVGKSLTSLGNNMQAMGENLTMHVTAPILAIGAGMVVAANQIDDAYDTIRIGTGATGDALVGLQDDFHAVFGEVPASAQEVGTAIADLNTRLGLTGEPLQQMTTQFLELSRITGTDVASNIETVTRVFGDWGVAADEQSEKLDYLFKVSQATGIGIDQLGTLMVQYGAPLRQMGFDYDTAAAMIGKFNKEGVNTELVMGSMRIALGKMASEGITDANEALKIIIERIKEAGSVGEANAIAIEMFGARAGPDMAAAIREGRFEIDQLVADLNSSSESILQASEDTKDFNEMLSEMKAKVIEAVEPLGTSLRGALESLEPAFDKIIGFIGDAVTWFTNLPAPIQLGVAALVALAAAIGPVLVVAGTLISSIGTITTAIAGAGGLSAVLTTVVGILTGPVAIAIAAFAAAAYIVYKNWDTVGPLLERVGNQVQDVFTGIMDFVDPAIDKIQEFVDGALTSLSDWWDTNGDAIMQAASTLGDWLIDIFETVGGVILFFVSGPMIALYESFRVALDIIIPLLEYLGRQFGETIMLIVNLINGDFSAAWENIKNIVQNSIDFIVQLITEVLPTAFSDVWDDILSLASIALDLLIQLITGKTGEAATELKEGIVNAGTEMLDGMLGWVPGVSGVVDGMRDQLLRVPDEADSAMSQFGPVVSGQIDIAAIQAAASSGTLVDTTVDEIETLPGAAEIAMNPFSPAITGPIDTAAVQAAVSAGTLTTDTLAQLEKLPTGTTTTMSGYSSLIVNPINDAVSPASSAASSVGTGATNALSTALNPMAPNTTSVMNSVASSIRNSGSSLAAAATSAGSAAVSALNTQLSKVQASANEIKAAVAEYNIFTGQARSSSSGSSSRSSSSSSSDGTGITRQGKEGTGERNVKIREAHATGGIAGYTGWHWMEKNELAVPEKFDWDGVLTSSLSKALKSVASSSVSNSYAGDTVINVNATLTPQYNFEALMRDIERELSKNKTRRGILS